MAAEITVLDRLTILVILIALSAVEVPIHRPDRSSMAGRAHPVPGARHLGTHRDVRAALLLPHSPAHGRTGWHPGAGRPGDRWDDIASVAHNVRVDEPKSPKIAETDGSRTLMLHIINDANLEIELGGPLSCNCLVTGRPVGISS